MQATVSKTQGKLYLAILKHVILIMSSKPIEEVYSCMQIIGPSLDQARPSLARLVWVRLACLTCLIHYDQHGLSFCFVKLLPNEE